MDKRLLLGETKYIEYKRNYSKTLMKTVSAFANYHDGFILIGIDDEGEIVGVDNVDELRLMIENAINDSVEPRPFYEIEIEKIEDKLVIILKVYKGEYTPYSINNKAFKRMDTSTIQVDRLAHNELILLGRNQSFETLKVTTNELEFKNLSSRLKKELNIRKATNDLLITLGLVNNNNYNNGALLFSDSNPLYSARIQLIAYTDKTVMQIKDREELHNISIIEQYDKCIDFYRKHINVGEVIDGPYRKTIEEVPLVAYREAVANAIVHRDYLREAHIKIEIFKNRIEIVSPGTLPVGLSEEEFRNGNISILRNRMIADIFLRLKIIEKIGTGIKRIKSYYQDYSVQPCLEVYENSIRVILPKVTFESNSIESNVDSRMFDLNENEKRIVTLLKKYELMSRSEIEVALGLKRTQTGDLLKSLRQLNFIVKVGSGSNVKYKLI